MSLLLLELLLAPIVMTTHPPPPPPPKKGKISLAEFPSRTIDQKIPTTWGIMCQWHYKSVNYMYMYGAFLSYAVFQIDKSL